MEDQKKQYKKVDVQVLQNLIEVIARSKTELTFLQIQELIKMVQESENIAEEEVETPETEEDK
ncbi:hypothetical protein [Marinilabilia salmonicolor]|uniref:hypothetical protein n=1 Tax=Marinilabilia salmonicolor TaxID=989 RepID=UPI000299FCBC|nr:hypothetical protein [Marinilabilia salmonicolor]